MMESSFQTGIIQALMNDNLLTKDEIDLASNEAKALEHSFIPYLIDHCQVASNKIADALANFYKLPRVDLYNIDKQKIPDLLETTLLQKYIFLPIQCNDQTLTVATSDPAAFPYLDSLTFQSGLKIRVVIADYEQLATLINVMLSNKEYVNIKNLQIQNNTIEQHETPVVSFINQIINDAIQRHASDIHFEPLAREFRIRIRVDGILYEITTAPKSLANTIISRLKILSQLDISEKRLAQDGRLTFKTFQGLVRDCRLNSCPTQFGEKIVLRILNPNKRLLNINELGMNEVQQQQLNDALNRAQGLILVTGPTGSGKTITLYSGLNFLNSNAVNISTIEDPVEIQLSGVNQINVNYKIDFTFVSALRALLRQDPDIIMVGEIRDKETADMAIRAAHTGHLVFSTLHTNNAAETLTRLINMGIAPFNVASALIMIVAQRLVRKLCVHCKQSTDLPKQTLLEAGIDEKLKDQLIFYKPQGCAYCTNGYKGQTGIFEILPISKSLSELIMRENPVQNIIHYMEQENISNLWQAGLEKVISGMTSLTEIYRVAH